MGYSIRSFEDGDAEALAELGRAAIGAIGPDAYSEEQVDAWLSNFAGPEVYQAQADAGTQIFIATNDDDEPVAYAMLEETGHLDHLYCHPDHTHEGLASSLLETAALYAKYHGITHLFTEASEIAKPAFESAGYTAMKKRTFEIDGVTITNWAMVRTIETATGAKVPA
ncbi:GNAT family N-acetyltransferase [Qipengyuania sp. 1NDW9]|uniref:GNAT family N-acetyltransferase n=1 Tax=Qipengyuania xiapuensis TaxID=2867236 RepID=A0ABX8ZUY0_9SPHN|nr:GNAT family N-acetyltransferase [Qipengyuania xiapuensis]MBX7493005.1 GNAT family N-acetyltransferase [Qipengyuania xiapuensis]QZD92841.1 GNAT family N-acetyltransferase [Qipengyuania xiapuensis]